MFTAVLLVLVLLSCLSVTISMDADIVDMLTPMQEMGEACGYLSCPEMTEGAELIVHVVPHTHGELGYTATFASHYTGHDDFFADSQINMKRILDSTISELWTRANRKFTLSDNAYFFHWWANRDETVRRMVYQLLRQGRLFLVGGGWSMSDEATTSYHAIIDQFTYSLRKLNATFLDCGRPLVAWQADVLGHSREFASLMAQMGFDGLFVNPISYDDELARMRRKGMEFIWRGSDDLGPDSDIFTHKLFDGYWSPPGFCFGGQCSDPLLISSGDTFNNLNERTEAFAKSVRYRQAPYYSTKHVMVVMGQRYGYYDASVWFENIDKLIFTLNAKHPKIKAVYSTPACYLKAVYESNPQLQTKQDDFFPYGYDKDSYAAGMYTSRPALKLIARDSHRYLQIAKQLQITARLGNNDKTFEEYMWLNGVFQDHNILTGQLKPHVVSYYIARMTKATQTVVDNILEDGLNKLRNSTVAPKTMILCKFNVSRCHCTGGKHFFIVIYNPLAWPVTMPVRLPMFNHEQVVYNAQGKKVRAGLIQIPDPVRKLPERNSSSGFELAFLAEDIPAMGIRSYYLQRHQMGWERPARSLIKKIKNTPREPVVRQVSNIQEKINMQQNSNIRKDRNLFDGEPDDYEYFDETSTELPSIIKTKILFGNVTRNWIPSNNDVLTPKSRTNTATTTESNVEVTRTTYTDATLTDTHPTTTYTDPTTTDTDPTTTYTDKDTTTTAMLQLRRNPTITDTDTVATYAVPTTVASTTTSNSRTAATYKYVVPKMRNYFSDLADRRKDHEHVTRTPKPGDSDDEDDTSDYWKGYPSYKVNEHSYIRNRYIRVNLDNNKRVVNVSLANGIKITLDIQLYYYVADDPLRMGKSSRPPGAYLFRTMDDKAEDIVSGVEGDLYKNHIVQELHLKYSSWASIALRVYRHSPVLELDWVVGPIPVEDGLGKEVLIKYTTDLDNRGTFYTDSNGRQTMKRIRNMRPMFEPTNKDPIAGNFYPVTSKIYIEDLKRNVRFAVLNDRAQGGSSLKDGEINMLIHRRLLTDDSGIEADLNETDYGKGTIIRGQHYIYISKADHKPYRLFEKKLAKEIELRPQILTSPAWGYGARGKPVWESHRNEYSALKSKLPLGVHILTLEKWNTGTILLRLENFLEKADCVKSGVKGVHLNNLFSFMSITDVKETTLAGNMWLKDWVSLSWNKDKFLKNFNEAYTTGQFSFAKDERKLLQQVNIKDAVVLKPQQIRTFVIWYRYV